MNWPWSKPAPADVTHAAAYPVLQAVVVIPEQFNGNVIRWDVVMRFDRRDLSLGKMYDETAANTLADRIRGELLGS